jgi:hypothetical protein
MNENHAKIIIKDFGMDNVSQLKGYGTIASTIAQNEIDGQVPGVGKLLYKGTISALEAREKSKDKPIFSQYNGRTPAKQPADTPDGLSELGTPVWGRLIINGGTYIDTTFGKTTYPTMKFDTVLFTLSQTHNVVLTPIQGRDYEVIEYIGKASFRINIKGGVFGTGNIRPVDAINNLKLMLNSNQPLIIGKNSFLSEWDITEFVILDKNIPQTAGGYNYQLFECNAIQNTSVILAQSQNVA